MRTRLSGSPHWGAFVFACTLGAVHASVYNDDAGGTFHLVATLAKGPESTPIRFSASLQGLTISVPGRALTSLAAP
jgi:hypothetical protein